MYSDYAKYCNDKINNFSFFFFYSVSFLLATFLEVFFFY